MTDADIHFYFDPVCPFAWITSKWVRMVAAQRDYTVDWRFISLRMINSGIDYDSHFPPATRKATPPGCGCCGSRPGPGPSTAASAVGPLYEAVSSQIFDSPRPAGLTPAGPRQPRVRRAAAGQAGLPAELADALDDTRWDAEIRAEGDQALSLTGRDVGTPIIQFQPPDGTAFFGPVISRLPGAGGRGPAVGPRRSAWPASLASPSSSGACASGPSCAASARPGRGRRGGGLARRQPQAARLDAPGPPPAGRCPRYGPARPAAVRPTGLTGWRRGRGRCRRRFRGDGCPAGPGRGGGPLGERRAG